MKKKLIISFIAIILIALAVFLVFTTIDEDAETANLTTIQLNEVTRSVFYAPQYVAIANGFFEDEGLAIEITTGQGAETPLP